jgi:acyl carrier protein
MTEVLDQVRAVIAEQSGLPPAMIESDTPILTSGLIDSMGMVEVVAQLEELFGIVIDAEDVVADNFHTPAAIAELVSIRQG